MAETNGIAKIPSDETFHKLLELQANELALRTKDLALREVELNLSAKHAGRALEAQLEDRRDEREHRRSAAKARYIAVGLIAAAVLAFAGWALYLNKDAIVLEALQIVGSPAVGFFC